MQHHSEHFLTTTTVVLWDFVRKASVVRNPLGKPWEAISKPDKGHVGLPISSAANPWESQTDCSCWHDHGQGLSNVQDGPWTQWHLDAEAKLTQQKNDITPIGKSGTFDDKFTLNMLCSMTTDLVPRHTEKRGLSRVFQTRPVRTHDSNQCSSNETCKNNHEILSTAQILTSFLFITDESGETGKQRIWWAAAKMSCAGKVVLASTLNVPFFCCNSPQMSSGSWQGSMPCMPG